MTQMYQQPPAVQPKNGMGTAALVLGIVGILLAWIPIIGFFGFILGALAIIFGGIAVFKAHKGTADNKVVSYFGLGLGVAAFVISFAVFGAFATSLEKEMAETPSSMPSPGFSDVPTLPELPPAPEMTLPEASPSPAPVPAEDSTGTEGVTDGTWVVGKDIEPGTYASPGPASSVMDMCYWARLKDTTGDLGSIVTNGIAQGQTTITIKSTDGAFKTNGCQPWVKQ